VEALRERFGKYHVLEKIAQGGMAEVYKVKTIGIAGFEKVQALKRILPHQAREPRFIRSFIDEARIAVELTHRNIVQVFDFGKADGELFLAMELIEGHDLRSTMAQAVAHELPPPVPVAAYIIAETALGLDYAHRKADGYGGSLGIVHCDVSPSNVMLSSEGDIKILDFGIARATFASALERRRLRGKPRYMSPEQTIGETPTAASDVFALGIIAWELFTGMALFRGADLKAILEAVRRTDPPRIDRINPAVPREIADAVATALAREPAARGTSADLAGACARTALQAGSRALALWLASLVGRPVKPAAPWQLEGTASVNAPLAAQAVAVAPVAAGPSLAAAARVTPPPIPPRRAGEAPVRPSMTVSLRDVPVPERRPAGTPVPAIARRPDAPPVREQTVQLDEPSAPFERVAPPAAERFEPIDTRRVDERFDRSSSSAKVRPATAQRTEPFERLEHRFDSERFERVEPTATAVQPEPTAVTSQGPREPTMTSPTARFEPNVHQLATRPDARWLPEGTQAGHARLADVLPDPEPTQVIADAPPIRRSYERLELAPGTAPAALRFDDDATHHGFALPEDTRYDELDPDPDSLAGAGLADDPIDDDLPELAAGALAERRRIVVVAGLLAAPAGADALRPVTKGLGELAYQRGGVVLELQPDALIVAFGLEVAGEDDVAIAMGWALDAAAIARDAGALELRIGARAGVAASSGMTRVAPTVTVTRAPDGGSRIPPEAIAEARALARAAAPDRPRFVGGAGRLTSSLYALRELPDEPHVIEVIGPRGFEERDRARLERRGALIGRAAPLAELDQWFARAIAEDRRLCILITGAAGIGKSRLVAELVARRAAAGTAMRITTTAASPASRMAPFAVVVDLYQAALGLPPDRGRTARSDTVHRLAHWLAKAGTPADRVREVTTDLDRAMELRDGLGIGAREAADLRPRISAGLAVFRTAMNSRARPAITIVEDVHLADSASLEVLRHTTAMPARGAELLILTARPEGAPPPAVDLVIELGDLVGHELRALITDRLGDAATPIAIATVLARAGGNPLFVEELAQAVRDAGGHGEDVPASARDVVSARVDRLSPRAKAALRFAAVMGGPIRPRLLEELLGEASLDRELAEAEAAGILTRPAAEGELIFARGLIREVVAESLSANAQRDSHARVGRLLASRFFAGREEPPGVIAEHLERGGEPAGAAAFWLRAGRIALSASDAVAAIACFTRALDLEHQLAAAPPTPPSRARRREALAGREEARRLQGDLAANPGDLDELEALCAGEPARLADVAIRRAQRHLRLGDYAAATDATIAAEDRAVAAGDDRLRGEALRVRGEILERVGRFDEALVVVGAARDLFHRHRLVADEMAAMIGRGRIHLLRAHYEAARDAYRPVVQRIDRTGDPWLERIVTNHVAVIEMCLGNFAAAMQSAQRSLELCRRYGDRGREGDALSVAGIILLEVGLYDQAAATFAEALDVLSRTNSRWSRTDCLIYTGSCELRRRRTALPLLDEAVDEARRLGARYLEANALVARAGAHLRTGALSAAIADASAGAAVARGATLVGYEIQGLARHALALSRLGNRTAEAGLLVHRAVTLLDAQHYLEGSEEEVLLQCATVLRVAGARDRAHALRERGRASARRKLAALTDPSWRAAYAAIPEIAELLA
jgi:tetratricopeptide (TPR) repeat protein/tRNA A-37 threonylcarbamoyl transferase component Bud32